jgi:hypothetical protein
MSPAAWVYRGIIVRAVSGERPASASVEDATRLEAMCERLAQAERVVDLLRARGLDLLPMDEAVALLLERA